MTTSDEHEHENPLIARQHGVNQATKAQIERLYKAGVRYATTIQMRLRGMTTETNDDCNPAIEEPTRKSINNHIYYHITSKTESPCVDDEIWTIVWNYLHNTDAEDKILIKQLPPASSNKFVITRHKYKDLIDTDFVKKRYDHLKDDFNQFIHRTCKINVVNLSLDNWKESKCSCVWFLKNYLCVHVVAIAVNKNLVQIPMTFKNLPFGVKPKRGRKAKALPALVHQLTFKLISLLVFILSFFWYFFFFLNNLTIKCILGTNSAFWLKLKFFFILSQIGTHYIVRPFLSKLSSMLGSV
jgi:hypothetical protein